MSTECRATSDGALRVAGHFLGRGRHGADRFRGGGDLLRLCPGSLGEVIRERLGLPGRTVELDRGVVDRRHELAQRLDRVVDRIGDRTGDVLGHGGLHGQVAVREARELVEQPQDRLLVALVLPRLLVGGAAQVGERALQQRRIGEREQGDGDEEERQPRAREPARDPGARLRGPGEAGVDRRTAFGERIARGLHLLEPVAEPDHAAHLALLVLEHGGEQAHGAGGRGRRRLDAERIALPGEATGDLAHVVEAVGQATRRRFDRSGPVGEGREILVDRMGTQFEALGMRRQGGLARRFQGLDGVRERGEELRRKLAHRGRGLLRLEGRLAALEHRLRLLEHRGPARRAIALEPIVRPRALFEHTGQLEPRFRQRIERRRRAAHGGTSLQRHVLRQRRELGPLLALASELAGGAPGQQQRERGEERRAQRHAHHDGQQPRGVNSIAHFSHPTRVIPRVLKTPPPGGTAGSRAGSSG